MYSSDEVGEEQNGIYANIGGTGWIDVQYRATADFVIADSGGDANVLYVDIPDFPILAAAADSTNDQFSSECPDCVVNSLDLSVTDLTGGTVASQVVSTLQRDADVDYVFTSFGDLATGLPEAIEAAGMSDRVRIVTAAPNAEQTQGVIDSTVLAVVPNPKAQGAGRRSTPSPVLNRTSRSIKSSTPSCPWSFGRRTTCRRRPGTLQARRTSRINFSSCGTCDARSPTG